MFVFSCLERGRNNVSVCGMVAVLIGRRVWDLQHVWPEAVKLGDRIQICLWEEASQGEGVGAFSETNNFFCLHFFGINLFRNQLFELVRSLIFKDLSQNPEQGRGRTSTGDGSLPTFTTTSACLSLEVWLYYCLFVCFTGSILVVHFPEALFPLPKHRWGGAEGLNRPLTGTEMPCSNGIGSYSGACEGRWSADGRCINAEKQC